VATNGPLIKIELARHVANEHVQANNRPHQWRYLDHLVLYDVEGSPNAYAFVFARDGSRFRAPTDLRQHISNITASLSPKQGQQAQSFADSDLFGFDDLATVITGATVESPLILRHFRGAPEFWIEAVKLETAWAAKQQTERSAATHIIMVTPMDFRLISIEARGTPAVEPGKQATAVPFAATAETFPVHSKKSERISAVRQQMQDREARARKRSESMGPEQRKRYEAALQGRKDFLRGQWESKRVEWEIANR